MGKGFTLIELLAVLAVLGIVAVITTPVVLNAINESKQNAYKEQVNLVESAAERWGISNLKKLPTTVNESCCITLTTLTNGGYLTQERINDPRKKSIMNGQVKITYTANQYLYNYIEEPDSSCKVCGV